MFAVAGRNARETASARLGGASGQLFVLPRPLRRVARFTAALAAGRIAIPSCTGVLCAALLFGATGVYGMVLGGHTKATMESTGSALGFAVDKVDITGNSQVSDIDVLQQLHLDGDTSLLTLDVAAARKALMELPWVEDAEVRKIYPGTVSIALRERKAFAIWQHGQDLSLIERSGSVIVPFEPGKFSSLPLYVGLGAETAAADFDRLLANWPDLRRRVRAAVRVSDRRWDLLFANGVTVKLPEENVAQALEDLSVMDRDRSILTRDIVAVDLRLADRITVQLSPAAAARREDALKERDKEIRRVERQASFPTTLPGGQA